MLELGVCGERLDGRPYAPRSQSASISIALPSPRPPSNAADNAVVQSLAPAAFLAARAIART